ncbi:Mu-like prophage major head subunit gpT [Vreelandella titanicae]|uniref:Mu-like prophage major head subunit gpT family protein n=1 Tax=Vreelandella titanicae TaxID=664683 RepID=UPI000882A5ED|nr:Mu-like prophage major head subunit gpT family protein [Halomonas titanicae]SDJ23999.1 Mu-like prophage major head subunit gpT [Halomonas titanicae]
MDLTNANLQVLFRGYNTTFQQGWDSVGDTGSLHELFCTVVNSTTAVEVYPWLKELPRMREWLGDRVIHGLDGADFSIKNRKFELTAGVPRDKVEDDTYGLYNPIYKEFGSQSRQHPNELAVQVLEQNPVCYDGQSLFDTDHPVLDEKGNEVSVSNDMGGNGPAWYVMDLSRAIKPMIFQKRKDYSFRAITNLNDSQVFLTDEFMMGVDARVNAGAGLWQLAVRSKQPFNAENYELARTRLQDLKGDYGKPLGLLHTHTMVPSNLEGAALRVLKNSMNAAGATNEWEGTSTLIKNHWLKGA